MYVKRSLLENAYGLLLQLMKAKWLISPLRLFCGAAGSVCSFNVGSRGTNLHPVHGWDCI